MVVDGGDVEVLTDGSGDEPELESDGVFNAEYGGVLIKRQPGETVTHGKVTVTNDIAIGNKNGATWTDGHTEEMTDVSILDKLTNGVEISDQELPTYFNGSCYGTGRYAHPLFCHQYFVCHEGNLVSGKLTMQGLELNYECPYPQLFDVEKRECAMYNEVECGNRIEAKSPCMKPIRTNTINIQVTIPLREQLISNNTDFQRAMNPIKKTQILNMLPYVYYKLSIC